MDARTGEELLLVPPFERSSETAGGGGEYDSLLPLLSLSLTGLISFGTNVFIRAFPAVEFLLSLPSLLRMYAITGLLLPEA